jgi:hypothetical protein
MVVETVIHPDHQNCDLALLRTDRPLSNLLACSAAPTPMESPISRGYSPDDPGWGGRQLIFTSRGLTNVAYPGDAAPFLIADAFDLTGDMAAPGYSGSPLLDPKTAAVLGIVSSGNPERERTWAIPLSAAAGWPPLQEALAWNDQNLPRFGRLVNYLGALEVCRRQFSTAISTLRRSRKFVEAWDVHRSGIGDIVAAFRAANQPALAIVGNANVGKTWLLCQLASDTATEPGLLLAGAIDRQQAPSLDEFAEGSLTDAWQRSTDDPVIAMPSISAVAKVCADIGRPLIILLDGINEALDVPGFRRDWLPNAVGFCAEQRLKLVLTSRPEVWPTLARAIPDPHSSLFVPTSSSSKPGVSLQEDNAPEGRYIRLADFSPDEAAAARQSYGVAVRPDDELGHHPLLFRAARDLGIETVSPSVGRYKLLQNFIDRQLDEVLSRVTGASIRSLRLGLQRVAAALDLGGSGGSEGQIRSTALAETRCLTPRSTSACLSPSEIVCASLTTSSQTS